MKHYWSAPWVSLETNLVRFCWLLSFLRGNYKAITIARRHFANGGEMGDLDVSLIREFATRPAFYNKANPHFKDRAFTDQAWAEISSQLGYDGELGEWTEWDWRWRSDSHHNGIITIEIIHYRKNMYTRKGRRNAHIAPNSECIKFHSVDFYYDLNAVCMSLCVWAAHMHTHIVICIMLKAIYINIFSSQLLNFIVSYNTASAERARVDAKSALGLLALTHAQANDIK